jgi:hypothetical protein
MKRPSLATTRCLACGTAGVAILLFADDGETIAFCDPGCARVWGWPGQLVRPVAVEMVAGMFAEIAS